MYPSEGFVLPLSSSFPPVDFNAPAPSYISPPFSANTSAPSYVFPDQTQAPVTTDYSSQYFGYNPPVPAVETVNLPSQSLPPYDFQYLNEESRTATGVEILPPPPDMNISTTYEQTPQYIEDARSPRPSEVDALRNQLMASQSVTAKLQEQLALATQQLEQIRTQNSNNSTTEPQLHYVLDDPNLNPPRPLSSNISGTVAAMAALRIVPNEPLDYE
eukprot:NODE_5916_length_950_cov_42.997582_g5330_i0.p1 GENE.NODE_5916_length_950_cov_42.997582_g5330_i0~~NODE_5916_length_950_cov_42.997582_g5330_i0.p1  ORF type:complete len:239 (+),score=65.84 NODE_5916_length_950_cov_42.997582_g5330_i0:71-718(+)